tara:strand:- start:42 stop:386 length:345 start_codon:yes stop_codon:yes gene_type:complete
MDIEIFDIEAHRCICAELDRLEQTIEKTKDNDAINKLIKQANEWIDALQKTESENNSSYNHSNNNRGFSAAVKKIDFSMFDGGLGKPFYFKTKSKVKYYRDRFDRFNKPKKNIL